MNFNLFRSTKITDQGMKHLGTWLGELKNLKDLRLRIPQSVNIISSFIILFRGEKVTDEGFRHLGIGVEKLQHLQILNFTLFK